MLSKKCHIAAWYSQYRWLKRATKGVHINNVLRRERGQGPSSTKGFRSSVFTLVPNTGPVAKAALRVEKGTEHSRGGEAVRSGRGLST